MKKIVVVVGILIVIAFYARVAAKKSRLSLESSASSLGTLDDDRLGNHDVERLRAPVRHGKSKIMPETVSSLVPSLTQLSVAKTAGQSSVQLTLHPSEEAKRLSIHYELDDGLAVAEGDEVLGAPRDGNAATSGLGVLPQTSLWPVSEIPVFIQPGTPHPERIQEALALFNETPVRFIPLIDQSDALVFQEGQGSCKSYVGRVGGKQPIWISAGCGAPEIAHEIMHALGFVHEQNRSDRDSSITVSFENIDDDHRINFEKMPSEMMRISGKSVFDFSSIMIYPDTMFSKNGLPTMRPLNNDHRIEHSDTLSPKDIERLEQVYGPSRK